MDDLWFTENKLVDLAGRQFDSIENLYDVAGNPECNDDLQPGFSANMQWVYRVPAGTKITGWAFADATDFGSIVEPTLIPFSAVTAK